MKVQKEKKIMSEKKFLLSFFALSLAVLLVMSLVVFWYDPYVYYRMPEDRLIINNYRFINPGIAKNAEYDAAVVGSSMTQNFDMPLMREELGVDPVKLSVGGMSVEGMRLTVDLLKKEGKAKTVFVCLDLPSMNKEGDDLKTYATYLYDDDVLNDVKYLCGYETWMRLLPVNAGFSVLDAVGYEIPRFYATRDIDRIAEWHEDAKYGKEYLISDYRKSAANCTKTSDTTEEIVARMQKNVDAVLELFDCAEFEECVVFLPPYSQIFWERVSQTGEMEAYLSVRKYILSAVSEYGNMKLFDFQAIAETADLDNYKDYTHYSKDINDLMVHAFASGEALVHEADLPTFNDALLSRYETFRAQNGEWLDLA